MPESIGTATTETTGMATQAGAAGVEPVARAPASTEVAVKSADFAELAATAAGAGNASLDNLLDVTVKVTAELGRATICIGDLLKLAVGSVVELDRPVSEPVDLMAQGVRLARGE